MQDQSSSFLERLGIRHSSMTGASKEDGVLKIRLGNAPPKLLDTVISKLLLDEMAQFNAFSAISAIANSDEMQAEVDRLGMR